jgi:hypothetical protein
MQAFSLQPCEPKITATGTIPGQSAAPLTVQTIRRRIMDPEQKIAVSAGASQATGVGPVNAYRDPNKRVIPWGSSAFLAAR